jgi:hypothetical protein
MKKLVWLFGLLLALSFVLPAFSTFRPAPVPTPSPAPTPAPSPTDTDTNIVSVLAHATADDKARVASIYTGLRTVLLRDKGELVNNTERFAVLQANTLKLAVDQVGKYPGLDVAIENVFKTAVGTDDVVPLTADVTAALVKACDIIANSAK